MLFFSLILHMDSNNSFFVHNIGDMVHSPAAAIWLIWFDVIKKWTATTVGAMPGTIVILIGISMCGPSYSKNGNIKWLLQSTSTDTPFIALKTIFSIIYM